MRTELKFSKRDKYEKSVYECWVEEMTKGQLKLLQKECWEEKMMASIAAGKMDDCKDFPDMMGSDHSGSGSDESSCSDSDSESATSTPKKGKKASKKKDKKHAKSKQSKKNKKTKNAKKGSPHEAIENAAESLNQALATINDYGVKFSDFHDQIAEIKATYVGKKSLDNASLQELKNIISDAEKTTLLKADKKDDSLSAGSIETAEDRWSCGPINWGMLPKVLKEFGLQADVPVTFADIGRLRQRFEEKFWAQLFGQHVPFKVTLDDYNLLGKGSFATRRWFKGADTTILSKYLEHLYLRILADCSEEEENILTTVYEGLVAINHFMSSVYNQPLIVQPADSGKNAEYGLLFMRAFNGAALDALGLR
ncbi:unnamed protein product, partial [Symbiodinium pilosum]